MGGGGGGVMLTVVSALCIHFDEWLTNTRFMHIILLLLLFISILLSFLPLQLLSLLPGRILKLLEFVGFSGDREVGLTELERGAASDTFRAPLCSSFLLSYYTVIAIFIGMSF